MMALRVDRHESEAFSCGPYQVGRTVELETFGGGGRPLSCEEESLLGTYVRRQATLRDDRRSETGLCHVCLLKQPVKVIDVLPFSPLRAEREHGALFCA